MTADGEIDTSDDRTATAAKLSAHCNSLRETYERTGELALLDRAVTAGRACLDLTTDGHPLQARRLSNLGFALRLRFERLGAPDDIRDAVRIARTALAVNCDPADGPRLQSNLGVALRVLFEVTQSRAHLTEAAELARVAVDATPTEHPDRPGMLSNLGLALMELSEAEDDQDGLTRAVAASAAALAATQDDDPDRSMYAINLSVALRQSAQVRNAVTDIDHAIGAAELAVGLLNSSHPDLAGVLSDLGRAHRIRSTLTHEPESARLAVELRRQAARTSSAPATTRALAARAWAIWASEDNDLPDALDGFAAAVDLVSQVAWHGLADNARERHLSRWRGLAGDAAATAIRAGSTERALPLLEQGRTVLWNERLARRRELVRLHAVAPDTANRLLAIRDALDATAQSRRVGENQRERTEVLGRPGPGSVSR